MSLFRERNSIKSQIIDTEKMLELVKDHPLMSISLTERLTLLKNKLSEISADIIEPSITLLFSGNAVRGSVGIKSSFVSKILLPFQEIVKTQSALVRFGNVARRGQAKSSPYTELFLSSLPVGSFGIELRKLDSQDLFAEIDVAYAMKEVIQLIKDTSESDEKFEKVLSKTPKRNLSNLKKFLKEVSNEQSFLEMESGELHAEISKESVTAAYFRVAEAIDSEEEIQIEGILRGFLLDSWKFEIQDSNGKHISGSISDDLSEAELIEFDQRFLNNDCKLHLRKFTTKFKTGNENEEYELLGISEM
ncbi:hypothetical protein FPZ43_05360 [Mucilaginibacter pallidiroseus]|uniref:Uncharacterized protein n=1 Tax=Mucilaginibacter pallidiroseus TaxID=2599295 RepID=A0A563UG50_9SPHI|nr:hypothetical protein [Mucilaginibacter pallidiroseus]TWR30370.1 hypothetical protein FPZ43_05360 [Mucilaginibacter pallidiroseus]